MMLVDSEFIERYLTRSTKAVRTIADYFMCSGNGQIEVKLLHASSQSIIQHSDAWYAVFICGYVVLRSRLMCVLWLWGSMLTLLQEWHGKLLV